MNGSLEFDLTTDEGQMNQLKCLMIQSHPTFACPVTKKLLDYRTTEIVKFQDKGKTKTDIISTEGIQILKDKGMIDKLGLVIVQNPDEVG